MAIPEGDPETSRAHGSPPHGTGRADDGLESPHHLGRDFYVPGRADNRGRRGALGALIVLDLLFAVPLLSNAPVDVRAFSLAMLAMCVVGTFLLIRAEVRAGR